MSRVRVLLAVLFAGVVYVLSPLSVWFVIAMVPLIVLSTRGLEPVERQWVTGLVVLAVVLRVLVIAGLFLSTNHASVPFGTFFGDEAYFIKRSLWLKNITFGVPVHALDLEYAFEPYGGSRYLDLLAGVQILVGPAPYGLHLVSIAFYTLAALVLYHTVRVRLGRMPAILGLAVLLFLPSLFIWSVSVLKEPLIVLIQALSLLFALRLTDRPAGWSHVLSLGALVTLAASLEAIRPGGAAVVALGTVAGLAIGFIATRPRLIVVSIVAFPILLGVVVRNPDLQLRAYAGIQDLARQHRGAVALTKGVSYHLLDTRFYSDPAEISSMRLGEASRFLVRSLVACVTEPMPWSAQSSAEVAFLPEQVIWYALAVLVPVGALGAFRRDAVITGLLLAHGALFLAAAAFTSGNVGTLVRHRDLAIPYLVWLSGVGACELIVWAGQADSRLPRADALPATATAIPGLG